MPRIRSYLPLAFALAAASLLGGCVVYPAYPSYGYYGRPYYGSYVAVGGGWWDHDGWRDRGWHR